MSLCKLLTMKNITVSVPEDIYRAARIRAAEEGRSVSGLVSEYLTTLGANRTEFARLEARQAEIVEQIEAFTAGDRLSRDELHARAVR